MQNPKVLISYSDDTQEHKRWISELATKLRKNGYVDFTDDTQFDAKFEEAAA